MAVSRLVQQVQRLFNEGREVSTIIVEVLLTGKPRVSFDQVLFTARRLGAADPQELAEEALLAMEGWRIIVPERTLRYRSIAWEDRINSPRPGETYEVPLCILLTFNHGFNPSVG